MLRASGIPIAPTQVVAINNLVGVNTGDQLLHFIGNATSDNYYKIAEWTLTGAWATFASHLTVMTTSKTGLFELYILCALNGSGTGFTGGGYNFKLKDVFGGLGTSTFLITVTDADRKVRLYFKSTTDYEPHYVLRHDSIPNSSVFSGLTNIDSGASAPTGTYSVSPTVS